MDFAKLELADGLFAVEMTGEQAGALGRAGRRVEQALAAYREAAGTTHLRDEALKAAADAVHHYYVLRELNGLVSQEEAISVYAIPREVLARVGSC